LMRQPCIDHADKNKRIRRALPWMSFTEKTCPSRDQTRFCGLITSCPLPHIRAGHSEE